MAKAAKIGLILVSCPVILTLVFIGAGFAVLNDALNIIAGNPKH